MEDPTRVGKRGQRISVTTNSFAVTRVPTVVFYQFDVITPLGGGRFDTTGKPRQITFRRKQEIIDRLQTRVAPENFTPKALYDGSAIMYASHTLGITGRGLTINVPMSDQPQPPGSTKGVFEVKISRAGRPITPTDINALLKGGTATPETAMATNLLQLLVRVHFNRKYPNNNRAYFTNAETATLGRGIELWRGFFQSVRPTLGRLLINVDTAMATMYMSGQFINIALDVLNVRNTRDLEVNERSPAFRKLESYFKKLTIRVAFGSVERKRTIRALIPDAGNYVFDKDGMTTRLADHFAEVHNVTVRHPRIIGVLVSPKNADNPVVYPAEFCHVMPGQFYKKKIPEEVPGKTVLDFATMRPSHRLDLINRGIDARGTSAKCPTPIMEYAQSEAMLNAGMQVSSSPISITGRQLQPPKIGFGERDIQPNDGAWNLINQQLNQAGILKAWVVLSFSDSITQEIANQFARHMENACRTLGMTVEPASEVAVNCHGTQVEQRLYEAGNIIKRQKGVRPQLFIVILPQAPELRIRIKHWGDVTMGVSTQCIRDSKIQRGRNYSAGDQYCANVALKINSRLGGRNFITKNSTLATLAQRFSFMVVGADVTHPGPGITTRPSIASLVFSWDPDATQYVAMSSVQAPRQEMIGDLKAMMMQSLRKYFDMWQKRDPSKPVGVLPQQIFFFRDGVSEGELEQVEQFEIRAIQEAIDEVWKQSRSSSPKAKLTFIVVGKRHHVRFFPESHDAGKSGNCKAGFVADRGLSSAFARDFYLLSHGGLLGTSRPSHYMVLRNDSGGSMDDLQGLAYDLCHVYAKATRSVSVPAPVYYADLVCARANCYFPPDLKFADDSTVVSGGDPQFDLNKWQTGFKKIHRDVESSMFFV